MTGKRISARRKGSYGIDAPYLLPIPVLFIGVSIASGIAWHAAWPLISALLIGVCIGCGWHTSRRGKFVVWGKLLNQLHLRGDERILDVGCGRGAVLLMAAQHLTTGRAVGIDLWNRGDQSGNSSKATLRNAVAEGVADRVEVQTAD